MNIEEVLDDVARHLDFASATGQFSIIENEMAEMLTEISILRMENKKLHSIIKEVREWAKKHSCQFTNDDGELVVSEISFNIQARPCDLFKILDKGE